MKIDGHEVKFSEVLSRLFNHFEKRVQEVGKEIVQEQIADSLEKIQEAADDFEKAAQAAVAKHLGPEFARKKDSLGLG